VNVAEGIKQPFAAYFGVNESGDREKRKKERKRQGEAKSLIARECK